MHENGVKRHNQFFSSLVDLMFRTQNDNMMTTLRVNETPGIDVSYHLVNPNLRTIVNLDTLKRACYLYVLFLNP
jgi:hypothetical protein